MFKKRISIFLVLILTLSLVVGCSPQQEEPGNEPSEDQEAAPEAEPVKVGMVTDSGTIDDKSFNQGTWEGILQYKEEKGTIKEKYLQPSGEQHTDYINAINDLADTGYEIIVTPGYKFETAVNEAAETHKDISFVIIDGMPHSGDFNFVEHENVVSVYFNEHETGFLAGVASALETKTGKLGYIGGMEIPAVQKFGWGFVAGVRYANENLGANAEVIDYLYQGTFTDVAAGQTLAAGMYNKDIDIIFAAAGGVGVGVFNEAKQRAEKGEEVYVVGVDVDQYDVGKLKSGESVTLTSAVKGIDVAAYNYIDDKINGKFPGGEIITLGLAEDAVGLPDENPNLSEDTLAKVEQAKQDILDGKVVAPATEEEVKAEGFEKFLTK